MESIKILTDSGKTSKFNVGMIIVICILEVLLGMSSNQQMAVIVSNGIIMMMFIMLIVNTFAVTKYIYFFEIDSDDDKKFECVKGCFHFAALWACLLYTIIYCLTAMFVLSAYEMWDVSITRLGDISNLFLSMGNNVINDLMYFMEMGIWIVLFISCMILAKCMATGETFKYFKGIAYIFIAVIAIVMERFLVKFLSAAIVDATGGITALFNTLGGYAVALVIALESLLIVLFIIINLLALKKITKKERRNNKVIERL